MKITFGKFHNIITEEVERFLSEIDISDKELDRLLAMGRKDEAPKEKVAQVIRDNPEEATDAMFSILGADGIKDIMVALAHAAGDEELLKYTKTISEEKKDPLVAAQANLDKMLGSMTINIKKWGTYSENKEELSEERQIIQNYVSMVGGTTPDEILKNLAASFTGLEEGQCDPQTAGNCNIGKLVSQIQLLNTMSTILNDFGGSEAGFIMEAFLSAVFPGGELVPIGGGTIADFYIHGKGGGKANYSLKTTDIKAKIGGSVTSLIKSIKDQPMIYYVFAKQKGASGGTASVTVYKFELNLENIGKILGLKPKEVQELVQSEDTGYLKRTYGRFSLDSYTYQRFSETVAVLTLDPVKLYEAAECELVSIKQQMLDIQGSYKSLAYEMSKYFSTMSSNAANQTKKASAQFYSVVTENVQGDDSCKD